MSWLKLFRFGSFESAMASTRKNNFHVEPALKGLGLTKVKHVFKMVNVPFVFRDKDALNEHNMKSPYHKFPRGIEKRERAYVQRVAKIRAGIASSMERELKYRQESLNKRPYKGINELIKKTMPFLIKQTTFKAEDRGGRSNTRKIVPDSVKGVPKGNVSMTRKSKEQLKNMMDDGIITNKALTKLSTRGRKLPKSADPKAKEEKEGKDKGQGKQPKIQVPGVTGKAPKIIGGEKQEAPGDPSPEPKLDDNKKI